MLNKETNECVGAQNPWVSFYRKLAGEELTMNIADHEVFAFPSAEDQEKVITIPEVEQRIKDVLMVLGNLKQYKDPDR